jgi:hypothetical protein
VEQVRSFKLCVWDYNRGHIESHKCGECILSQSYSEHNKAALGSVAAPGSRTPDVASVSANAETAALH